MHFHQEEREINHKNKEANYINRFISKLWNSSREAGKGRKKEGKKRTKSKRLWLIRRIILC